MFITVGRSLYIFQLGPKAFGCHRVKTLTFPVEQGTLRPPARGVVAVPCCTIPFLLWDLNLALKAACVRLSCTGGGLAELQRVCLQDHLVHAAKPSLLPRCKRLLRIWGY